MIRSLHSRWTRLAKNAGEFGVEYYSELDMRQGVVHIVGPEQGSPCPA
jgi:3-isopropylmalate/(R)-2-methylmalate dehydratase large subunit